MNRPLPSILLVVGSLSAVVAHAGVVYSNAFAGASGLSPKDVAEIDPGLGHQVAAVQLDGGGRLVSTKAIYGSVFRVKLAAAPLTDSTVRLKAVLTPDAADNWVGFGFKGRDENKLNEESPNNGPWVLVTSTGVKIWGGAGTNGNSEFFPGTHSAGDLLVFELTWHPEGTINLSLNGSVLADGMPIAHEFPVGTATNPVLQYAEFQFAGVQTNSAASLHSLVVETVPELLPDVWTSMELLPVGALELGWNGAVGASYAIDFRGDLAGGGWSNIAAAISGTAGAMAVTTTVEGAQGFYRVRAEDPAAPIVETWDVTRPEAAHSAYLQDTNNCTADMAAIMAEAKERLAGTRDTLVLQFPAGTYVFDDEATGVYIDNLKSGTLVVRGAARDETTLRFNRIDYVGFWIHHSDRIVVENLHLTRPGYYASEFDVVDVDQNGAWLQIHEGFPTPEELKYHGKWNGQEVTLLPFRYVDGEPQHDPCDRKRLLHQVHGDPSIFPFTDLGGGLWHAQFRTPGLPGWGPGDMVALKMRTGQNTLRFHSSDDCVARDLLITRFCGNPIRSFHDTNRLLVERVHVARPIGGVGGRTPFFSGSDGGIQLVSGTDGPTVRDCIVESTADDAIAVFSSSTNMMSGSLLEGNTVYDGQARGIGICQSQNGVCRSNTFHRGDWYSISIYYGPGTVAAGSVTDWEIYGNVFIDSRVDPVIGLDTHPDQIETLHDNIHIHDNLFIGVPKNNHILYVNHADRVTFSHNTIVSFDPEEDMNSKGTGNALVYVEAGLDVAGIATASMCRQAGHSGRKSVPATTWTSNGAFRPKLWKSG